jgi:hypothetical protein
MISELTAQVGSVTVSRPVFTNVSARQPLWWDRYDLLRMSLDENSA